MNNDLNKLICSILCDVYKSICEANANPDNHLKSDQPEKIFFEFEFFDHTGIKGKVNFTCDTYTKDMYEEKRFISKDQYQELLFQLDGHPNIVRSIMNYYGVETLKDIYSSDYDKVRSRIEKIKRTEEEYLRRK